MSLKAKLEAVIYAAEEPVTLAQLAALFATDARDWKAEREAASAAAATEQAEPERETPPPVNAEFNYPELDQAAEAVADEVQDPTLEAGGEPFEEAAERQVGADEHVETGAETSALPVPEAQADLEAEAKRIVRLRDREARATLRGLLDELMASYASDERGIEIKEIAGGYRMATKPECHDAARLFVKSLKPMLRLSLPALETLAVVAYKQPVTAPEVNEIRGVDSSGVFGSLLARKLIATAGRKQVIGRPILYKTTREFLLRFGLKDVSELPSMEEFEKMAQLEFDELEPAAEVEASPEVDGDLSLEIDVEANEQIEEPSADLARKMREGPEEEVRRTAATAANQELLATGEPDTTEPPASTPAMKAEPTPAEAAPAAPSPQEQAETETVPHE